MEHTADFTISALRLSGIPVYREGLFFTLPSGSWSVVEACSGLRYLIASVTIGFLYAHLMYRSLARRAIFVAAAVIVPIIANWLRAYMIVMIGHLSSMQHAVGVDHLIYGWLFFGVVMGILFWFASFWREDLDRRFAAPSFAPRAPRTARRRGAIAAAAIAAVVMVSIWPLVVSYLENSGTRLPLRLEVPPQAGGWQPVDNNQTSWTPRFVNPEAQLRQGYTKDSMRAGLYIGYYADQRPGAELITSVNRLVGTIGTGWVNTGEVRRMLRLKDEEIPLIEAHLRGPSIQLLVWRWYRVDGQHTASPSRAKLLQARSRLLGRGDDGAVIVVYTEVDEHREAAVARLQDFVSAMLTGIERSLDHAR
jgi:EpsI family protein